MTDRLAPAVAGEPGVNPNFVPGEVLALCALGVGLLILYFGWFNHDFSVDGLRYAREVDAGGPLFHPNHLLPNAFFYAVGKLLMLIGAEPARSIWMIQGIDALAGIATALCICRALCARCTPVVAALSGALYSVGFAAWNFAEEPCVYVLPAMCVALSLAIILRARRLDWPRVSALGVLAILAILFLQQYVFWLPALLLLVWNAASTQSRLRKVWLLAVGVPVMCLTVYLIVGASVGAFDDSTHALGWFFGYAYDATRGFGTFRPPLPWSERGVDAMLGLANLVFSYDIAGNLPILVCAGVVGITLLVTGLAAQRQLFADPDLRPTTLAIGSWMLANFLFALWWEARNIEFLFPVWLGAIVLLGLGQARRRPVLLLALVCMVGAINFCSSFFPQRDFPPRYFVAAELADAESLAPNDLLITEELNTVSYLAYFHHVDVRFLPGAVSAAMHASTSVAQVRASIEQALAAGNRVYTTEISEHGRLYRLAREFSILGRSGFDGAIDRDLNDAYRGYTLLPTAVAGVQRVVATSDAPLR